MKGAVATVATQLFDIQASSSSDQMQEPEKAFPEAAQTRCVTAPLPARPANWLTKNREAQKWFPFGNLRSGGPGVHSDPLPERYICSSPP